MKKLFKNRFFFSILISLVIGLFFSFLFYQGFLYSWQLKLSDNFFIGSNPSKEIVIAGIDGKTLTNLGRWPINRTKYVTALENLKNAGVKTIGVDVLFSEPSVGEDDQKLDEYIKSKDNIVQPILAEFPEKQRERDLLLASSITPPIIGGYSLENIDSFGHVNISPDSDSITRRVPLIVKSDTKIIPNFDLQILKKYDKKRFSAPYKSGNDVIFGKSLIPTDPYARMIINFAGGPKTFPVISFSDIVDGSFDKTKVKDKIVLIGVTDPGIPDAQYTPTSRSQAMYGVEIHANILHTILSGNFLKSFSASNTVYLIILLSLLLGILLPLFKPLKSAVLTIIIVFVYIIFTAAIFEFKGIIFNLVWPALTMIFVFLGITLYRIIFEEKKSKEIKDAFGKYVSTSVLHDILAHPEKLKLGGEKREMTVMFSDIRGFTTLSEKLKPEELVHLLNAYLDSMTKVILENQGVLDKYIGDAIMAFWNAPINQKEHAILACQSALAMKNSLKQFNEEFTKKQGLSELKIGVGINTGDMIAGNMGSTLRFDYTVIGDSVNLASRLEGTNKEYGTEVIISESTYEQAKHKFTCRELDLIRVKGKKEPIKIFEVVAEGKLKDNSLINIYEEGLKFYRKNNFELAIERFSEIISINPNDGPANLLLERCKGYLKHPPEKGWGGVYDRRTK